MEIRTQTFDDWNEIKKSIESNNYPAFVNEREICFVSLGKNVGFEQNGKHDRFERPVLVLKRFGTRTFVGIPLTTKPKIGKFYYPFSLHGKTSAAILSQLRLFDTKRIERKL
jgi:mRNA interferase MazF